MLCNVVYVRFLLLLFIVNGDALNWQLYEPFCITPKHEIDNSLNIDVSDNMLARFLLFIIDPGESAFAYWTQRCFHHEQTDVPLTRLNSLTFFFNDVLEASLCLVNCIQQDIT